MFHQKIDKLKNIVSKNLNSTHDVLKIKVDKTLHSLFLEYNKARK